MAGLEEGGEDSVRKKRKRQSCLCSLCNEDDNIINPLDQFTTTDKSLRFNDIMTADVHLSLYLYNEHAESTNIDGQNEVHHLYLHSKVLRRSHCFSTLLSKQRQRRRDNFNSRRRKRKKKRRFFSLTYKVPSSSSMKSIDTHLTVIELLYSLTDDDVNFSKTINTVSSALSILPVAKELLFEDCVRACIRLLEALPWTKEEEKRVLELLPLLEEEEYHELNSRLRMDDSWDEMLILCRLIHPLRFHYHHRDFVGKMLREFPCKDSVRLALYHEFEMSFKGLNEQVSRTVVCSSESRPVVSYGGHLFWLIGRMIELRVADTALDRWIDQEGCSLIENLQKLCSTSDKRIPPAHLVDVFTCTMELANAVATGCIVANIQVRMKLVKAWLPLALCFKDMIFRFMQELLSGYKCEEPLFKILSTLPMLESHELLLQCTGVGNPDYCCPQLETAYETWFRRAANWCSL